MLSAFIKFSDGTVSTDSDERTLLRAMRDPKAVFWLDMHKPTDHEVALLDDVFGFHPLAIEDSINYSQRPKIESYNHVGDVHQQGYFYMVIHGPDLESFRENLRTKELDLFISERYMVSIHDETHRSIDEVRQKCARDPGLMLS